MTSSPNIPLMLYGEFRCGDVTSESCKKRAIIKITSGDFQNYEYLLLWKHPWRETGRGYLPENSEAVTEVWQSFNRARQLR